ncbi:Type 1 glutamine amidotransferase-like domain-containing protein [Paenibacillus sp. RC67]|uniref:Type 1 glutamine amidotransferase-like domain-containing protein n=1 Tax=Paenibacillus sp. RC67 TaxID=3039392 RepID=UPI0024AE3F7E|nr:Type 1 glutamine amidotransferase-like domain-containing protein [Paenibacillus sp. RC67]
MRKMLLTSTAFPTAQITEAFLDLLEQAPTELTAAIITTAAVELREQARPSVKAKHALETMGFRKVDFIDIEFEDANRLAEYDVICLSGGNPFHLLHHLRLSGSDKLIEGLSKKESYL